MKYKLIFFDFDGTIVNTLPDISASLNHTLNKFGLKQLSEDVIRSFIGEGTRVLIEKCMKYRENEKIIDEVYTYFSDYYKKNCYVKTSLYDGVNETLGKLTAKKIIFTNKPLVITKKICKKSGIYLNFDKIISPEVYKIKKPDPEPIFIISKKYKIELNEMLFVGDSSYDIDCSKNAGIKNCIVRYGYSEFDKIRNADILIDNFSEILNIVK
jgi:phosphoglycolate phosphatase